MVISSSKISGFYNFHSVKGFINFTTYNVIDLHYVCDHHYNTGPPRYITEILLKVTINTINKPKIQVSILCKNTFNILNLIM